MTKDSIEQRTLSVSARNIPTEYELTYTVTFAVQGTDKELLEPQTINLSRDYSFNEYDLLAKDHEADILRRQMARDLVAIANAAIDQSEIAAVIALAAPHPLAAPQSLA